MMVRVIVYYKFLNQITKIELIKFFIYLLIESIRLNNLIVYLYLATHSFLPVPLCLCVTYRTHQNNYSLISSANCKIFHRFLFLYLFLFLFLFLDCSLLHSSDDEIVKIRIKIKNRIIYHVGIMLKRGIIYG